MIHQHPILHELVQSGHLTKEQANAIHEEHLSQGKTIRSIAIEQSFVREEIYLSAVAKLLGTQVERLSENSMPPEIVKLVPATIARTYRVAPIRITDNAVVFAISDFPSHAVTDDIAFALSKEVRYIVTFEEDIEVALLKLYDNPDDSIEDQRSALESDLSDPNSLVNLATGTDLSDLEHAASATPVIQFVNLVLHQAVKERASDIHLEPFEHEFKIRYRVDGALFEMEPPPKNLALPIISRVKVIAGLDIAESRLPQDGRIQLNVAEKSIDFRVSTLPTQSGESVVLRVLDRSNMQLDLNHIGFPANIYDYFLEDIQKPNGIVIVTGPTGSGKTTTLYAALQQINRSETKILTAEDPIEYDVEGIIQLPIRESIGLTFSAALRSFLRQDPDVIMVGEIRDQDTAQISIQASLTGHLVFSTLHTNDAAGAITRLIDMDVDPYLIASTLEAVMGQRLVRSICPNCSTAYRPDDDVLALLQLDRKQIGEQPFYRGEGCERCSQSGYSGRHAIFEYLRINDSLRTAILEQQPTVSLRNKAIEQGMRTLREDGICSILNGRTTVEEVLQYT